MIEKILVADMSKLEEKDKKIVKMAVLNRLLGKKCAVCELEYKTEEDILNHRPLGGYGNDLVGKECWNKYLEEKPIVESLDYIGGQDEDLGGYCEPLIIRVNREEKYVLHEMHTYRDSMDEDKIKAKHHKLEFGSLEELLKQFKKVKKHLGIDKSLPWEETDKKCGYDIPDDFEKVDNRKK